MMIKFQVLYYLCFPKYLLLNIVINRKQREIEKGEKDEET